MLNGMLKRIYMWAYNKPNIYLSKEDILDGPRPNSAGMEIINICNAKCTFCGYGKGEDGKASDPRKKRKFDIEAYKHTLKLYNDAGGGTFALSPILGEVSAHPKWLEMVKLARSFPNITGVSCFTNAILLHRFGSENILTSGITAMSLSTSLGSQEQYERLYGVKKYTQVVNNILDILKTNQKLGYPVDLSVQLRIDKPFEKFYSSELYKEMLSYKPSYINQLDDEWDDFRGVIKQDGIPKGQKFKKVNVNNRVPCYALYRKMQVLLDGTIQGCSCRVEPDLWADNIQNYETLEAAWKNPKLQAIRDNWQQGKVPKCCTECTHYIPYTKLIKKINYQKLAKQIVKRILKKVIKATKRPPKTQSKNLI